MKKALIPILLIGLLLVTGCFGGPIDPMNVITPDDGSVAIAGSVNGRTEDITVDEVTHALITIDYPHHEIHEGDHYYIEGWTMLNDGDLIRVKLVTPDTATWAHFTWDITSGGVLETGLYEDASGGMAGGVGVTPLNNNRNSTKTSGMTITKGITAATNNGTLISIRKVGGTAFKSVTGGAADRTDEIILKRNTTYFRYFLSGSDDNIISFKATWYEHEDR